ncbi:hypothetical protein AC578_3023 [Pseudocercospora eumusae]|uniref:Sodium bile acid symporter family protein n=1 Tax=Pseudocercospora eumusae TaxID=321146 RepID=A0A139H9S7_9PEZI|nr:hypothetical protein AC578_3023 [Pseudocercospora eumusae]
MEEKDSGETPLTMDDVRGCGKELGAAVTSEEVDTSEKRGVVDIGSGAAEGRSNGVEEKNTMNNEAKTAQPKPPSRSSKWNKRILSFLDDQWFLICMGFAIVLASQKHVPESRQKVKSTVISYVCVSIIFFATGCTLDTRVLVRNYSRWKAHLWVQAQCFLMCSALMFGVVSATATNKHFMDPGLLVGLMVLSCVPTTMASNVVMTGQAKGNQELTVVQTTIGNFISAFVTPALVVMYISVPTWYNAVLPSHGNDQWTEIYRRVLKQLGLSIYIPLVVGQVVRYFFQPACNTFFRKWKMGKISSVCMLIIIWSTYDQAFASKAFGTVPSSNLVFLVFILLTMWAVYFSISFLASLIWFSKEDVIAITYCVAAKGPAAGVPLSATIFAGISLELESKIQVPIVIYQALQVAFGSLLIVVFRRWIKKGEQKRLEHSVLDSEAARHGRTTVMSNETA